MVMRHHFITEIEKRIEKGEICKYKRVVLYPYGGMAKQIEVLLQEKYGIVPDFYVDNLKADGKKIFSLEQVREKIDNNTVILIASNAKECFGEIREKLYNVLPNATVIDLFYKISDNSGMRRDISIRIEKTHKDEPVIVRKALALAEYFEKKPIRILPDDYLVGELRGIERYDAVQSNLKDVIDSCDEMDAALGKYILKANEAGLICSNLGKHIVPQYEDFLSDGIQKRIEKIKSYADKKGTDEQEHFYRAQLILLDGLQKYVLRVVEYIETKKLFQTVNNRETYLAIKNIAYEAPKTFLEAVQLLLFLHIGVVDEVGSGSISFGRLDQYLYPYYRHDIETGRIDENYAQKIIIEMYRKISNLERSWQNVTLGGSDKFGNDESNELTIMCLNASLQVHADQPQVSLRVNKNTPQRIWDKAFELIRMGRGIPALFNDEIAVKAKMSAGVSEEDAWNYSIVGCVELSAGGKEYSHTEGMRINWAKVIELLLYGDEEELLSKEYGLEQFKEFKDFYEAYKEELRVTSTKCCDFLECARKSYSKRWVTPFISCLMAGCIEKARDVTDGGTVYNNMTINAVGIASTVDSLEAVESIVYNEKKVSLEELVTTLKSNFRENETLFKTLLKCNKFGNDEDSVDAKAADLIKVFNDTIRLYPVKVSDAFQVGYYTSYFHSDFGKLTQALPDGRKKGLPLSSSLSPVSGMDNHGPIAVLNSLNKINMQEIGNGMVLDMKFAKQFFEEKRNVLGLKALVETYFDRGGMEIQFNVVDRQTLLEAQENPLKYSNLIVRVSGFSAYFIDLDKELQDEIICRTENS